MRFRLKVLIIGDGNSIWIRDYIKNVLIANNATVFLYTGRISNEEYLQFYKANNVVLFGYIDNSFIQKFPIIRGVLNILYSINPVYRNRYYDAIHVHFADKQSCWKAHFYHKLAKKEIYSFWGSDLFRASDFQLKRLKSYLDKCHMITVATQKMHDRIISVFGNIYDNKIRTLRYGIESFDIIDNIKKLEDKKTSMAKLGLPNDKIILNIGYNASVNQQHLAIIEQLAKVDNKILDKLFIVIQMTYGNLNIDYHEEVREKIRSITNNFKIFENFMQTEDIARFRCCADIFIHGQTTDALSASFQEYIYAGAVVLNAKWLQYNELEERGIRYIEFGSFEEIPMLVTKIVSNLEEYKLAFSNNRDILRAFSSVEAVSQEWYSIY
ncbi:MAG: 4-alpha-L-fucosyltransferase [Spirochaetes bacterium ADurb.Bin110]|jgi:hypothetical protein|nr:MAG: 4-alpha-L-fucosyltransferase [Spirochaetes bacterium ADurb.Bin110]